MLIRSAVLAGIREGTVTQAFRRWRRPTVRTGGALLTPLGRLQIVSVSVISLDEITGEDAREAGFASLDELVGHLRRRSEGTLYRVRFGGFDQDSRIALREAIPDAADAGAIIERLADADRRSADGPWTRRYLELIEQHPARRAGDLAQMIPVDTPPFKARVRRLKQHGLTESLEVGYRLSPRGEAVLAALRGR